ncbi:MAG: NADP-dependent succinic semialdehyde dehydrogenase [Sphingorhabdus sp.]|nr:NADP-dependent succinic semialdehyde dehydrogenase [Sphingorhabdus sp.]
MTIDTRNPATGEQLESYAELTEGEIETKLAKAADRYADWRQSDYKTRTDLLASIADAFESRSEELGRQITLEMGKTFASAKAEAEKCATAFRFYAENGPALLEDQPWERADGKVYTRYLPMGPVLAVMPWNFPLWQAVRFLAPTIMAGNVGLLKHASVTMGCAELIDQVLRDAGAPEGLFQNLVIKSDAVAAIVEDDRIVAATLTGSEGAGSAVAETAGKCLKKMVLELGGSDPFIVMPSADIADAAEKAVKARIQNTGQSCICGKRMIVHADVYDSFMDKFRAGMKAVKWGDPFDENTDMGPLSSFDQRDTVLEQIEKVRQTDATVEFGGEAVDDDGAFMDAGIISGMTTDNPLMEEELFGPVAMVFKAKDADDAIRIANASPYGLGSAVFTQDEGEQQRFANEIESGMTAFNQVLASMPEAPFGGIKRSGYGRELSAFGLHEFMNAKTVFAS